MMAPIAGRLSNRYPAGILGSLGLALLGVGMVLLAMLWRALTSSTSFDAWRSADADLAFSGSEHEGLMSSAPAGRSGSASGIVPRA
jgi:DHA2 family multidrug resistance protein-like MFS transporter